MESSAPDPVRLGSMAELVAALQTLIGPSSRVPAVTVARRARIDRLAVSTLRAGLGITWADFLQLVTAYDPARRADWVAAWHRAAAADPGGRPAGPGLTLDDAPAHQPGHRRGRVYVALGGAAATAAVVARAVVPD